MNDTQIGEKQIAEEVASYVRASRDAAGEAVRHQHLAGTGACGELEAKLCQHYEMDHALCVSSGTSGLFGVLIALNIKDTSIITTPYTWGGTLAGALMLDNRPIFADIESDTLGLCPEAVRRTAERHPEAEALLAVDVYGVPADMQRLREIANEFDLWYIADAAQSFGAYRDGMPASAVADALVVSFTTGKSLFAGEGGAIITDDDELHERLVWHTQHPLRQKREVSLKLCNEFGLNARIHPLAAIWANTVFEKALEDVAARRTACLEVIDALNKIGLTECLKLRVRDIHPSFFRLTAAWKNSKKENALSAALASRGYEAQIEPTEFQLAYRQPAYRAQYSHHPPATRCEVAENQVDRRFCLCLRSPLSDAL